MGGGLKLFQKLDENTDMKVVKDEWMKHFREEHAKREAAEAGSGDHWLRDMMFTFKSGCDRAVAEQEKAKALAEAEVDEEAIPEADQVVEQGVATPPRTPIRPRISSGHHSGAPAVSLAPAP